MHITILLTALLISGCSIHNETLDIGDGIVTVKMVGNKPKIRAATGLEECRWRGKGNINKSEYEVHFQCSIDTDRLNPYASNN